MIDLPYFPQTRRTSCVSACLRMVLASLDLAADEIDLVARLQRFQQGLYVEDIASVEDHWPELQVRIERFEEHSLTASLHAGEPVIVYLNTAHLSYWNRPTYHAVVVVGAKDENYLVHDPYFPPPSRAIPEAEFLRAWSELGNLSVLIRRRP